jgi:hypothetical protein
MCSLAIGCQIIDAKQGDVSGKTHLRSVAPFESGSAMRESVFNHSTAYQTGEGKRGALQVTAFGGQNTQKAAAAAYYMPWGHKTLTFQGQQTFKKADKAFDVKTTPALTAGAGATTAATVIIPYTRGFDTNEDTSIVRPWHFGITHAATYDPYAATVAGTNGTGAFFSPQFKSTISPEFHHSHAGAAAAFRYHLSDEPKSFWFEASTAVEWVRNEIKLNEKIETENLALTTANYPINTNLTDSGGYVITTTGIKETVANPITTAALMKGEVHLTWISTRDISAGALAANRTGTSWPVAETVANGGSTSVDNVTEAFTSNTENLAVNKKWLYGKINGAMKKTRLADVELKMGYNFIAEENYNSNGYLGIVIPTGNKATGEYVAEAVVGNGFHVGLMAGGTTEIMVNQNDDWTVSYRMDTNARYLLKNTQKRSFDLVGNPWSRYLMVWNKDDYTAAKTNYDLGLLDALNMTLVRNYSAGVNFFTKDMYVTPGFQARINQSLLLQAERYSVELGWNVFAREAEKVSLAKAWTETIAFPDAVTSPITYDDTEPTTVSAGAAATGASHLAVGGLRLTKNNKTYQNDTLNTTNKTEGWNAEFEIKEAMINLESAASPQSVTHTPYVSVNYMLGNADSARPGTLGMGASYEFAQNNSSLSQWQLWGKLGFNF